jgi:hypothetical protein
MEIFMPRQLGFCENFGYHGQLPFGAHPDNAQLRNIG